MKVALLTYYNPHPEMWSGLLSVSIMTKEKALTLAHNMVGKPMLIGMRMYTVEAYDVVDESDPQYGRIFVHCQLRG